MDRSLSYKIEKAVGVVPRTARILEIKEKKGQNGLKYDPTK